jgi:hypothetical protein
MAMLSAPGFGAETDSKSPATGEPAATGAGLAVGVVRAQPTNAPRGVVSAVLHFRNGDRLPGEPVLMSPDAGVRWARGDVAEPIDFKHEQVAEVEFFSPASPPPRGAGACRVRLRNGEVLDGDLVEYDSGRLLLETWHAGALTVPKTRLETLIPLGLGATQVYQGPSGLDGWTLGKLNVTNVASGQWSFRNGAFYAGRSASIARDLELPDVCALRFDLAWKGNLHLAVALFTDYLHPVSLATKEKEPDFGGFYSLQLNTYYANILPVRQFEPLRYLGSAPVPVFTHKSRCEVELRVNKSQRVFALLVDGALVKQWTDPEEFAGRGTGVRFVHQGQGQIRLANIRVLTWDGSFDEPLEPAGTNAAPVLPLTSDRIHLRNGDRIDGSLETIRDAKALVVTGQTRLSIPLNRFRRVELGRLDPLSPAAAAGLARLELTGGGQLSLRLHRWTPDFLEGDHAYFGPLKIRSASVERIVFPPPP